MAEKIEKPDGGKGAKDAATLFPDGTLTLKGARIKVREFRFLEGLEMTELASPIIEGLPALETRALKLQAILGLIAKHRQVWTQLLARSIDRSPEWVADLSDSEGLDLSLTFWSVNGPFFIRRVLIAAAGERAFAAASRSPRSSASSSPSGSGATSETSPSG